MFSFFEKIQMNKNSFLKSNIQNIFGKYIDLKKML